MDGWRNYTRQEIAAACQQWGPILDHWLVGTDDGRGKAIDGPSLLWAIAGNESSFGANCKPKYEPAYDIGGKYLDVKLYEQFEKSSAYSYGPWQVMLTNAPGFTPNELACDLDKAATATVGFLHRYVFGARKAITLDEALDTFNSGNWKDKQSGEVMAYVAKGVKNYFGETTIIAP